MTHTHRERKEERKRVSERESARETCKRLRQSEIDVEVEIV
jgi:hypothetical protein